MVLSVLVWTDLSLDALLYADIVGRGISERSGYLASTTFVIVGLLALVHLTYFYFVSKTYTSFAKKVNKALEGNVVLNSIYKYYSLYQAALKAIVILSVEQTCLMFYLDSRIPDSKNFLGMLLFDIFVAASVLLTSYLAHTGVTHKVNLLISFRSFTRQLGL